MRNAEGHANAQNEVRQDARERTHRNPTCTTAFFKTFRTKIAVPDGNTNRERSYEVKTGLHIADNTPQHGAIPKEGEQRKKRMTIKHQADIEGTTDTPYVKERRNEGGELATPIACEDSCVKMERKAPVRTVAQPY